MKNKKESLSEVQNHEYKSYSTASFEKPKLLWIFLICLYFDIREKMEKDNAMYE